MKFPDDESGRTLRAMSDRGLDMNAPQKFEFFAVFATEPMADAVARQYVDDDFPGEAVVGIETRPTSPGGMELELVVKMLPTYENVSKFESRLASRVAEHDGYLDGWGVILPPQGTGA